MQSISVCCSVLSALCDTDDTLRKQIRREVLPSKINREIPLHVGDSLKALIVRALSSIQDVVKSNAGGLIYTLCKKNVNRMNFHVGFGNAAGFLMENGLLSETQKPYSFSGDLSSDEEVILEEDKTGKVKAYDAISGTIKATVKEDPLEGLTDEERKMEEEKLLDLMAKLEKTGMLKMTVNK
ncbi:hypothetical protein ROZALSC1DRAFT_31830 [Rozella allomycis CSF55]|uniref:Uncharacterized protein n=1 Tax=Rozella allomycis (strain CSF55) TaxID=988480 RepID=A0A4P9YA29_ROZAC|nr:hypothetical protein ROZALSC1DRAFT_31830 [Rozella allomycis CSF55]